MRRIIALAALLLGLCLVSTGQSLRVVKGRVVDQDGTPIAGAGIRVQDFEGTCISDSKGDFTIQVPSSCRKVRATKPDYLAAETEIDGSFLVLTLQYDSYGVKRRENAVRSAAEAEAKKAEKVVQDSIAAVEKARKEAQTQARADSTAKAKAEKKARRAELDANYDAKFKNKGLSHSISAGYAYEIVSPQAVIYRYSGELEYGALHPFQFTYTLSWKFNRWVSAGIGAGALLNAKSITIVNDEFYGEYGDFKEHRVDVPVFLNLKTNFSRTAVRPYISLTGGVYCLSKTLMAEAGIGCEYRFAKTYAVRFQASVNAVPWPSLTEGGEAAYKTLVAPGVKIGFDF